MAGAYRLIIVGPDDEVLDTIFLDGLDLSKPLARRFVGDAVADGMGGNAQAACAARPPVED